MIPPIRIFIISLAAMISCIAISFSQVTPRVTISGRVTDDSTHLPIPNVNVFIANSTLGTGTDEQGRFQIRNVPVGPCEIVASRVGYLMRSIRVKLTETRKAEFQVELHATNVELGEVVVSAPDPSEWRNGLERFRKLFIGTTSNARQCKILNPEVLDFKVESNGTFIASVRAPLRIDNPALGYHIEYYLTLFRVEEAAATLTVMPGAVMTYEGQQKFSELLAASRDDSLRWKENREKAFNGSLRHFLICLFNQELEQEGYVIRLYPTLTANIRDPRTQRPVKEEEILFDGAKNHEKIVRFKGYLEVEYLRESIEYGYDLLRKRGTDSQVSWLRLNYDEVTIDSRGAVKDWFPTKISGYWAWKRVGDALPLDYDPEQK
jgi:hypothetical protein